MTPRRALSPYDWGAILALVRQSFAFMDGRIDPPSSMHRLTWDSIAATASNAEIWVIEEAGKPLACVFLTPAPDHLYLGKLAVAQDRRHMGLARRLIELAEARARALGLPQVQLETRVELTENHAFFAKQGFHEIGRKAHPGYDRPTSLTFAKPVA